MADFDADAYVQALVPPTFKVGGRVYVGRFLSWEQWVRMQTFVLGTGAAGDDYSEAEVKKLVRRLGGLLFDPPAWAFWRRRPSTLLLKLPIAAQKAAIVSFIACQVRGLAAEQNPGTVMSTSSATPDSSLSPTEPLASSAATAGSVSTTGVDGALATA